MAWAEEGSGGGEGGCGCGSGMDLRVRVGCRRNAADVHFSVLGRCLQEIGKAAGRSDDAQDRRFDSAPNDTYEGWGGSGRASLPRRKT